MDESPLKEMLLDCSEGPFEKRNFVIGHRGAALQFPEHTRESYEAAARMGAGIIECDVTFTRDRELVCRHAQCDLHTTTNILATPLAEKCSQPFQPAQYDPTSGEMIDEYKAAGIKPSQVFAQSFNLEDILYWLTHEPGFSRQAVFLDDIDNPDQLQESIDQVSTLTAEGVNDLAPPLWALVTQQNGEIEPSEYALTTKANGLKLITWTLERSGLLESGGGWY